MPVWSRDGDCRTPGCGHNPATPRFGTFIAPGIEKEVFEKNQCWHGTREEWRQEELRRDQAQEKRPTKEEDKRERQRIKREQQQDEQERRQDEEERRRDQEELQEDLRRDEEERRRDQESTFRQYSEHYPQTHHVVQHGVHQTFHNNTCGPTSRQVFGNRVMPVTGGGSSGPSARPNRGSPPPPPSTRARGFRERFNDWNPFSATKRNSNELAKVVVERRKRNPY